MRSSSSGALSPARRAVGVRRGDDQLADPGRRAERYPGRDQATEAETEQIGLGDPQMVEQRDNVTGQRLDRHRAVSVGGVPVALELHRDHVPPRRKGFEQRAEIEVDGHQAAGEAARAAVQCRGSRSRSASRSPVRMPCRV